MRVALTLSLVLLGPSNFSISGLNFVGSSQILQSFCMAHTFTMVPRSTWNPPTLNSDSCHDSGGVLIKVLLGTAVVSPSRYNEDRERVFLKTSVLFTSRDVPIHCSGSKYRFLLHANKTCMLLEKIDK